jgi:similar to stage IV sporulation protein
VTQADALSFRFWIRRRDLKALRALLHREGCSLKVVRRQGWYWKGKALLRRPVLLCLIVFLLTVSLFLPTRILFVRVEGNRDVPARQILSAAEASGIGFGASRKQVRSEKVKNQLLSHLPQLQWAGVNTSGCTAVISVRERTVEEKKKERSFSNLIATQDGYILSQTVLKGTPMFSPGQSVLRGQVLVSGYTDCDICLRADRAEGEIFAQTSREVTALFPAERRMIRDIGDRKYKISLIIRKKRINLWKDSRISDTGCGRMYEEYYVSLPGGYRLPIALAVEQYPEYDISGAQPSEEEVLSRLQRFSDSYLLRQTVAGKILQKQQDLRQEEGCWRLDSRYICTEMIGKEQEEQIGDIHEQRN